jgi:hypothetical protein
MKEKCWITNKVLIVYGEDDDDLIMIDSDDSVIIIRCSASQYEEGRADIQGEGKKELVVPKIAEYIKDSGQRVHEFLHSVDGLLKESKKVEQNGDKG